MLRVLVLTVATVVLAEAGYQYNAPSGSINQPAPFTIGYSPTFHTRPVTDDYDKPLSHSVSYKDYIYSNRDVERLPSNVKNEAPLSIQPVAGAVLNSGYSYNSPNGNINSIAQSSTSSGVNLNAGYAHAFTPQITVSAANSGFNNNAFAQSSSFSTNLNNGYAPSFDHSNDLSQSNSISTGFSNGNVQPSSVTVGSNLNNGYSYSQPQSSSVSFASSNAQSSSLSGSSNFNSGFSQSPHYSGNSFASSDGQTVSASSNLNTGFSQSLPQTSGAGFASVHSSPIVVSSNLNSGYSYSAPQTSGHGFASGNAQTSSLPVISNPNIGYQQNTGFSSSFVQPVSNAHFSNGYSNEIASSGSSSFSNAYNTIPSGSSNFNSGVAQSVASSSSGSFNNGYVESSGFANPSTSFVSTNLAQSSSGTANSGFVQSLSGSNNLNTAFSQQGSANQAIFKHIYFHAPPPEIEDERFGRPAPPPKKNYKIIFIKVPSQESKSNLARLQFAQSANGVGGAEHKTLIYVLVKNPDDTQQVIPKKVPSEHEVFFVKYNGNPLDFAARVNEEIDKTGSVQSVVPLEPGLVNGHKY